MVKVYKGGWFLLLATISLVCAHQPGLKADSRLNKYTNCNGYRPVLQPSETEAQIGTYILESPTGKLCLKATMGLRFIVIIQKREWYFDVDPSRISQSGYCGDNAAVLSLMFSNNSTGLQLTFKMEKSVSYVTELKTHISPLPVCNGCACKTYTGVLTNMSLFKAPYGQSYKCTSQSLFALTEELKVKLVPLQIQAFSVPDGGYSQEVKCLEDFNSSILTTILWASAAVVLLTALLTYLVVKDRRG